MSAAAGTPAGTRVAIVGAGRVGLALADMLRAGGGYRVLVADCTEEALANARARGHEAVHADASRTEDLRAAVAGRDVVVAAVPDLVTARVAEAAAEAGAHYLDFSPPDPRTDAFRERLAPGRLFLGGCGVSPGLADLAAIELAAEFPGAVDLVVRVGAIPARQTNRLGYGLIWNLDGLLAEYTAPCEAIADGARVMLPALSQREEFTLGGVAYEAFCTAGGLGSLIGRVGANVRNLVFRTIRYPGHVDYMQFLLDDLGLRHRRDLLLTVLRNGLPPVEDDVVLVYVTARGEIGGAPAERSVVLRVEPNAKEAGRSGAARPNALALGSAAHAAGLLDLVCGEGRAGRAAAPEGRMHLGRLLDNRFLEGVVELDTGRDFMREA